MSGARFLTEPIRRAMFGRDFDTLLSGQVRNFTCWPAGWPRRASWPLFREGCHG